MRSQGVAEVLSGKLEVSVELGLMIVSVELGLMIMSVVESGEYQLMNTSYVIIYTSLPNLIGKLFGKERYKIGFSQSFDFLLAESLYKIIINRTQSSSFLG